MPKTTQDRINKAIERMFPNATTLLFDYDGTVADTERLNYNYWVKTFGIDKKRYPLSQYREEFLDIPEKEIRRELAARFGRPKANIPYVKAIEHLAKQTNMKAYEYVQTLIGSWSGNILMLTNAPAELATGVCGIIGLGGTFTDDNVYSATDDETTIPEYMDVLESMGDITKDTDTIVVSDNPKLIGSCKRRGYATIGIENGQNMPEDIAHFIILTAADKQKAE